MIPDPNPQMPLPIFAAIHSVQQPANGKRQPAEPFHYTRGKQTYPVRLIRYQKIYAVSLLKLCYRRATRSSTQRAHRSTLNGCATFLLQSVSQTPPEHHTYTLVLPTVCLLARVAYVLQLMVTLPVLPKSPPSRRAPPCRRQRARMPFNHYRSELEAANVDVQSATQIAMRRCVRTPYR